MSPPDATRRYFGSMLIGVGSLIVILCGACSACGLIVVIPSTISLVHDGLTGQQGDGYAPLFLQAFVLFGLVPMLIGAGVYLLGRRVRDGEWPSSIRRFLGWIQGGPR
jgi:hypothetical protein